MLIHALSVAFCLLAADGAPQVEVELVRGDTLTGEITSAAADQLSLSTASGPQVLPANELSVVRFPSLDEAESPRVWVELLDGSVILAGSITTSSGRATIELLGGDLLTGVPARSIRSVRFHRPDEPSLNMAWNDILTGTRGGDVLVLRKTATVETEAEGQIKTTTTLTLDELEGTVLQISPDTIKFDFDGDKVDVKREKLEGIVFFQPVKRELPPANLKMEDTAKSQWLLRTVDIKDGRLQASTPAGVTFSLPLARIKRLDFSAGNVAMLAQLPMEASDPSDALLPKGLSPAAVEWFQPMAGKRPGAATKSNSENTSKIALTGKSQVTYRTPEGFRWFRAKVVLANKQGAGGDVDVVVLGDGKPLAKQALLATSDRAPLPLEVDVSGVRRVSLQVVPHQGQGIGALVDFQNARFTK